MRLSIHPQDPQPRLVRQAVDILKKGGVIVYPTDTVYGLGCDIYQKKSVERIYQLKRMDKAHPVSLVCSDLSDIARYGFVDDYAYRIMKRLIPGPYTFILKATREVPKLLIGKRKTVGIRVPDHKVALALVAELGHPIVSTSASMDAEQHSDPDELALQFKQADAIVDSGWGGLEPSTIVDLNGPSPTILREGAGPVDVF